VGHVARMQTIGNYAKFWSESPEGRDHSEYLSVDDRIILE